MVIVRRTAADARKHRMMPAERKQLHTMTDEQITAAALSDLDNPPLTKKELAQVARIVRKRGRPPMPANVRKVSITVRISPEAIRYFKSQGCGWQTRIGEVLTAHVRKREKPRSKPSQKRRA